LNLEGTKKISHKSHVTSQKEKRVSAGGRDERPQVARRHVSDGVRRKKMRTAGRNRIDFCLQKVVERRGEFVRLGSWNYK
jgi:hypothetical protein